MGLKSAGKWGSVGSGDWIVKFLSMFGRMENSLIFKLIILIYDVVESLSI